LRVQFQASVYRGASPDDRSLKAARDAHDTKVDLIEFEMKIGAKAV
jgi:hypothetical protein